MSWTMLDRPKTVKATRSLAQRFVEMKSPPQDRDLVERRLMVYRALLARGEFRPVTWATCYCEETDETYRVNGKHTSTLLASVDQFPENFFVVIETYTAPTLADVAKLYATFDSKIQSRTAGDINKAFAASIPELRDAQKRAIDVAVTGLAYAVWQDAYATVSAADRAELLLDNVDFVRWLDGMLRGTSGKALRRGAVAAAMLLTFDRDREACDTFWKAVRDETGASPSLPDRKLAKFLIQPGMGSTPALQVRQRVFFVKSIHAWNAWRTNKPTNLKYVAMAPIPDVV